MIKTQELPEHRITIDIKDAESLFQFVEYNKYFFYDVYGIKPNAMACGPEEILKLSAFCGEHRVKFPYMYDDEEENKPIHFDYPTKIMGLKVYLKQNKGIEFLFEETSKATTLYPRPK